METSRTKRDNMSFIKLLSLVFMPTAILTTVYAFLGSMPILNNTIPALLLFFVLAAVILFPIELGIVLCVSKKEFGRYSLKSAFINQKEASWNRTIAYGFGLFGLAGIVSITVGRIENLLTTPISSRLVAVLPAYFDWNNMEVLRQYPRGIILTTCIAYVVLNAFIGPIVEELFFRGYLTSKIGGFGKLAPLIITVLFSLYHFWLPLQNIFRIFAFFPAAYVVWKEENLYIGIVFHCLCNLFSTITLIVAVYTV